MAEKRKTENAELKVELAAASSRVDMTTFADMLNKFGTVIETQAHSGYEMQQAVLEQIQRHDARMNEAILAIQSTLKHIEDRQMKFRSTD